MAKQFVISYQPGKTEINGYMQENYLFAQNIISSLHNGEDVVKPDNFILQVIDIDRGLPPAGSNPLEGYQDIDIRSAEERQAAIEHLMAITAEAHGKAFFYNQLGYLMQAVTTPLAQMFQSVQKAVDKGPQ